MSYVYMKVLESAPRRYERGMRLLTLGRVERIRQHVAAQVSVGDRVLDIGCGTGALATMLARQGAHVTGIDIAPQMLNQAAQRVREHGLAHRVELRELGAVDLDTAFPGEGFDVVVSILVFSELSDDEIEYVLAQCRRLLRPDGRLIIADEVLPDSTLGRIGTFLLRLPFVIAAYLLTQNTTRRVADLEARIARSGFRVTGVNEYLLGTMRLVFAGKVV